MALQGTKENISYPIKNHFWANGFPAFPFGGICDGSLGGIDSPFHRRRLPEISADDHSDNQSLQRPEGLTRQEDKDIHILVGGFNPVETYSSKWIIFPNSGENKNIFETTT